MHLLTKLLERPGLILKNPIKRQIAFHRVRPEKALLFLTFRCNSRCSTCTFWTRDKKELQVGELTLEQWKTVTDKLHANGVRRVELFGGNILLRTDLLIPLLEHLHKLRWNVFIPTNQIGLDQKTMKAFVDYGVDTLFISTDGIAEHQNKIRGFKGADNLNARSIKTIRDYREEQGQTRPKLVCNTTVSKFNVDILEEIPEYAIAMGFDEVHFEYAGEMSDESISESLIDGLKPTPMFVQQNGETILASREQAKEIKRKIARIRKRYRSSPLWIQTINIDDLGEEQLSQGTIPHKKCYDERLEVNVDPYGNIVACPMIHNYSYGSILDEEFSSVWNNDRHRRFRKLQNCGELPMCNNCILGVERNPTLWRALKRSFKLFGVEAARRYASSNLGGTHNDGPRNGAHRAR